MDILDRAEQQIAKAFDALDRPNPDHDTIKERIAGAMACAAIVRARIVSRAFAAHAEQNVSVARTKTALLTR